MVQGDERKLPAEFAQLLAPRLVRALDHPARRKILRVLDRGAEGLTLRELTAAIPSASVSVIGYHVQVLVKCGCVSAGATAPDPRGALQEFRSSVGEDRLVVGALRATQDLDALGG